MEEDFGVATLYSKVKVSADETYASLRLRLEDKAALEWPFEFWDNDDQFRVPQRMESFSDMPGHVYVLPLRAAGEDRSSKRQRVDDADAGIDALPEDGNRVDIHDNCLQASSSSGSGLLSIGSDCAVHFVQRSTTRLSSTVRSAAKRKRGPPSNPSRLTPTNCLRAVDEGVCWLGRVQAMRRRNGKQFGVLRQPVDLLARLEDRGRRTNQNPHIEVMLQYYRKYVGRDKFKYDHTDSKWIDIDCVICNVTLAYNPQNEVYSLDRNDAEHLRQFLADHSAR